jgi:DNA polymerase-3 subunit alpha (Gram-positive type)
MKHPILRIRSVSDDVYEASDLRIEALSSLRIWVFDLEATGLDVTRERVTQIAGAPIERGRVLDDEAFVQFVYPGDGVEMPKEVQELTGITPETVAGAPQFPEAWSACLAAARGCDLWIGQSVFEFDVPLLEAELARHGMEVTLPPILDSVVLATGLLGKPEGRWSMSALVRKFKTDTEGLRRHDALGDVKILSRVLVPMMEMIAQDHGDRVFVPSDRPLTIKRHPPVKPSA